MKITFLQNMPDTIDKPFGVYQYDEQLAKEPNYVDIRGIIWTNDQNWLDQVQKSHAQISAKFLGYTRWWWVTGMSRLDARPWGQEHLFKPLFFARAVLEWLSCHPDIREVYLVGCPREVAVYLKEFKSDLVLDRGHQWGFPVFFISFLFKHVFMAVLKLFKNVFHVARHHLFRKGSFIKSNTLILYEAVANLSLTDSYKFYYNGLFDHLSIDRKNPIAYGCIDSVYSPVKDLRHETNDDVFFVLDSISFSGFIKAMFINLYLIFITAQISLGKNPCTFGGHISLWFWPDYLLRELSRTYCFGQICCYDALQKIFKQHKYKGVVSSYEEKTIERATLFACNEAAIPVIGYIPHPQHHLTLALRNVYAPYSPKPEKYAVCGQKYIDYFLSWCKKKPESIVVWGSKKSLKEDFVLSGSLCNELTVLLLISHPNELKVFYSWLRAEPRISRNITYLLRIYKAANCNVFSKVMSDLMNEFNCVKQVHGSFEEDLSQCDLAAFCGTSAGLVAVNRGRLAIQLTLDDFFYINPCFGDLSPMLSCVSAVQFADRLDQIRIMDRGTIAELHEKQQALVAQIFSPIQTSLIEDMVRDPKIELAECIHYQT